MTEAIQKTLSFEIAYDEEAITIVVDVNPSPNQDKIQRTLTLEGVLKRQGVKYDIQNDAFRIFLHNEAEVEKVIECFRIFEKQDKIKETKLNVHRTIASELGERLKSIFPPPEAEVSVRYAPYQAA